MLWSHLTQRESWCLPCLLRLSYCLKEEHQGDPEIELWVLLEHGSPLGRVWEPQAFALQVY